MASAAEQPPSQPGPEYLASTRFLDCESEAVRGFADRVIAGERAPISRAIKLFYAVRDQWRYDPLSMRLTPDAYITSHVLLQVAATSCIPKAILLAAAARAVGIPAGMGLADVVNQLTTPKLRERVGGAPTSCTTATRPSFIPLFVGAGRKLTM
ncbi:MAG: transglutaminase domain-containing protein [Usitatibacter sp.]